MLKKTGYNPANVKFVPVSAHYGANIVQSLNKDDIAHGLITAEHGSGTLFEAIQAFRIPKRPVGKPLRIPLDGIHRI